MTQQEFFFPVASTLLEGDNIYVTDALGLDIPKGTKVKVLAILPFPGAVYILVEYNNVGVGNLISPDTEVELVPPF